MQAKFLFLVVLVSTPLYAVQYEFSYLTALRGSYVFPADEGATPSNSGVLTGKDFGTAGKSHGFRPLGLELAFASEVASSIYVDSSLRWSQSRYRLNASAAEQDLQDSMLTLALRFQEKSLGGALGLRFRHFNLSPGSLPDSAHAGLIVQFLYKPTTWNILAEAGLMAVSAGLGKEWGVQRDASSLRLRVGKNLLLGTDWDLMPFVEFFHLHRSFFATELGSDSLFVDDASLSLGLSLKWY